MDFKERKDFATVEEFDLWQADYMVYMFGAEFMMSVDKGEIKTYKQ